jgi:IS605 OrfB family transposase
MPVLQAFFAALSSWRERRKTDPNAIPPRRRKWYFRIEYKSSAIALKDSLLFLSNGHTNVPLILFWEWDRPKTVVVHWTGTEYEAIATYQVGEDKPEEEERSLQERRTEHIAGIDLGEVHLAVSSDGERAHLFNGRFLRSKRQYRNKLIAKLDAKISRCKKGSNRRKKLIRVKKKQLNRLTHQIQDIEHKQTSSLVNMLHREGVEKLVIGDVRAIRHGLDKGSTTNQKLHQWVRPKCSFCMVPKGTTGGEKPYGQRTNRRWKRQKGPKHVRKAPCLEVSFQAVVPDQGVIWLKLACLKPSVLAIMDGVYEELHETYTGEGHRNRPLVPVVMATWRIRSKICTFVFLTYLSSCHTELEKGRSSEVLPAASEKQHRSYEKHTRFLAEHAQGSHEGDVLEVFQRCLHTQQWRLDAPHPSAVLQNMFLAHQATLW